MRESSGKERLKAVIQDSFRQAFKVKSCSSLCEITRRLKQLFIDATEIAGGVERYLAALRFALELTCEKSTDRENRINCLKMSANVALALSQEDMPQPLKLLVDFCIDMNDLCIVITRCYICSLAGILLNLNKLIANRMRQKYPESAEHSPMSRMLRSSLHVILARRLLDASPQVRLEAIKSLAALQDDQTNPEGNYHSNSPKRLLISHLNDVSWECRAATVKKLTLITKEEIDLVVNVALSDGEMRVKKTAYSRIIKDVDVKSLSIKQRMDFIQSILNLGENSSRSQILNELLKEWLKTVCNVGDTQLLDGDIALNFYSVAPSHLLRFLEPLTQEQVSQEIILQSLQYCRSHLDLNGLDVQEFIKILGKNNPEDIMLNRLNYAQLLERNATSLEQANSVFYWRCLLEFCLKNAQSDADWLECQYRLMPTMHTFCDFLQSYVTQTLSDDENEALFAFKLFAVMQLLKMIVYYDANDPAGWKSWKGLCDFILGNLQLKLSKAIVSELVQQMFSNLWPSPQNNDEALSNFCDLTSLIVHRSAFPNATMLMANQTISIAPNETFGEGEPFDVGDDALYRCIMVVNAMLKTNRYKSVNTLLRSLLENIIEKGVVSVNTDCRILAFEAMGILAMYDRRVAYEKTILIKETLAIDQRLKPTMLNILCNMTLLHGYKYLSHWFTGGSDSNAPTDDLLHVFCEYIDDADQETSFAACECLCKMFLKESSVAWISALSRILVKAFDPYTNNNPKLKACLVTFIPVFVEASRNNQILLIEAFPETFDTLRSDEQFGGSLSRINVSAVGSCFVHATTSQLLNGPDKEKGSVQPLLCQKILAALGDDPEDDYASIYCKMLTEIDPCDWNNLSELSTLITETEDVVDLYSETEETKGYIRALTLFARKLRKRVLELESTVSSRKLGKSTIADDATEALNLSNLALGDTNEQTDKLRRQEKPKSVHSKYKSQKASKLKPNEVKLKLVSDLIDQNEDCTSSDEKQLPVTKPAIGRRPVLARAAKANCQPIKDDSIDSIKSADDD